MRLHQLGLVLLMLLLASLASAGAQEALGTREYYVAAEEVTWDFAPSGRNVMHGREGASGIPAPWTGNTRKRKVRYIEYTDGTFTTRKPQPEWLGVLGPVIRAEVGDKIRVHFLNRAKAPFGMHPHGLRYTKEHEGAHYRPAGAGAAIAPGQRFTYEWTADEGSGPGPADPSSVVWWYHSHIDEAATHLDSYRRIAVVGDGRSSRCGPCQIPPCQGHRADHLSAVPCVRDPTRNGHRDAGAISDGL